MINLRMETVERTGGIRDILIKRDSCCLLRRMHPHGEQHHGRQRDGQQHYALFINLLSAADNIHAQSASEGTLHSDQRKQMREKVAAALMPTLQFHTEPAL